MKTIKRLSFLLAVLLLIPVWASCSSDDSSKTNVSEATSESVSESTSEGSSEEVSGETGSVDISADLGGHLSNSIATSGKNGVAKDKNIIMIQLNSVSAPIMDASMGSVTPHLNALKGEGIYFSNFFNQAADSVEIEYSALNSLLAPITTQIDKNKDITFNSLANVLKASGYTASAFTGVDDRCFDRSSMFTRYGFDKVTVSGGNDAEIYSNVVKEMKNNNGKGFWFVSNIDSCYPYIPNEKTDATIDGASVLTNYALAANKADTALKAFIDVLKSEGLYDNSLIVIYGSAPMLDCTYEEASEKSATFLANGLDTAKAHNVPMVILGLGNEEYKDLATVYDIFPTIVDLTASKSDDILIYGENLFAEADRAEKFFPIQGSLCRGSYISNKVCFMRYSKTSVKCVDRVTGEEYPSADHKATDTLCKKIANECEYVVSDDYFNKKVANGEVKALKDLYENLHSAGKLVLINRDSVSIPTAKTALMSYHTQFYYAYDLKTGLYGMKVSGRKILLEDGKTEGVYVSPTLDIGTFETLYTGWDIVYNGGKAEIYVSVEDANGVASSWFQIASIKDYVVNCTPYEDDSVKVNSSRVYLKNGASTGKVKIKIKLFASADGKSPELDYVTFTTESVKVFNSNDADDVEIEKAELKVQTVQKMDVKQSGAAAVASLVSSTTGKKPDITGVSAGIYDQASDSYTNLAAICEYVHSLGIDAFIEYLDAEGVARVFEKNQQVLTYDDATKTFSIIYGFEGKKKAETYYVYNILNGKTEKVSAEKFAESWNGYAVVMNTYVENITPHTTVDGKSSILPKEAGDRPGLVVKKKSIIIHNTGNYNTGSGAYNHALYKLNNSDVGTSWHFTVDDKEIYQHLPTNESAWHASDGGEGFGNLYGIGIEICVNGFPTSGGIGDTPSDYWGEEYEAWEQQFRLAYENAAQLVAQLLVEHNLTIADIYQHNDTAPDKKNCPMQMRFQSSTGTFVREGDLWLEFIKMVELRYNRLLNTGDKFNTINVK